MGIWDQLRSVAARLTSRNSPNISSYSSESWGLNGTDFATAVTKFGDAVRSSGAQKLEDYVPDPERREKIGQIVTNLGKFAINSAVNESLKGVTGGVQVYKIVKEGSKDQPSQSAYGNNKPNLSVVVEEMQAKMEKMQEDINNIRTLNAISTHCVKAASDPLKELLAEPSEESAPPKTDARKVMIRSRL